MNGGIWGVDDYGRPTDRDTAADAEVARTAGKAVGGLASALWAPIQYVGDVARGNSSVFDPESGHVAPQAVQWGASQAMGRLPTRYSAPAAAVQMARGSEPVQVASAETAKPGYRLSENVENRIAEGSPYIPSQRAQFILNDIVNGPTSSDPARRARALSADDGRMADEIGGFNQPRIEPGLSNSLGDRELRLGIFDALNGQDLYPAPVYTGRSRP